MAIVSVSTCKLHAHKYIPQILGGGELVSTLLVNLFELKFYFEKLKNAREHFECV